MAFTPDEQQMMKEALSLYLQYAGQQVAPAQMEQLTQIVREILTKLDAPQEGESGSLQPAGINDEWFEQVCATCPQFTAQGCADPVTKKFPGKCDPILKYEQNKGSLQ